MFSHICIRPGCGTSYQSEDEERYYCPTCNVARKEAAKSLDSRFNTVGQQPKNMFDGAKEFTKPGGEKIYFFKG